VDEVEEFRATMLARQAETEWKIVHRHADNPGPDVRMGEWKP
jgi:ketosteroid isomerase-like protein